MKCFSANGKQGPAAMTNNKQEKVDQMQADNVISWSGIRINDNNIFVLQKQGHPKI
jgi:hypothetical protein